MTESFSLLVVGTFVRYLLWETEKKIKSFLLYEMRLVEKHS